MELLQDVENSTIGQTVSVIIGSMPENPLISPFEKGWNYMNDNFSRFQIAAIGSFLAHEIFFIILNALPFIFQFLPFMHKYKVQKGKVENYTDQMKAIKLILFSHFFIDMPFFCGTYIFTEFFNIPFLWEEMPPWYDTLGRCFIGLVIEDTWHYFMHRLMHHKSLYKYCHKIHHNFQAPFSITAEYAHPVETMVLGMGTMFPVLFLSKHLIFMWAFCFVRMLETFDVHSGYELPFNPLHLIPFYGGTRFHDFHHKNFVGNYSSTFTWWDKIFGTDQQFLEYCKKLEEEEQGKKTS